MAFDFETELIRELRGEPRRELPEGTMAIKIPEVRLRVRAIRSRERVAIWIAPWLRDADD